MKTTPRKKKKKRNIMAIGLLIYVGIIAFVAYPKYKEKGEFSEYFLTIGVTLTAIIILWFLQRFREKYREKMNNNDKNNTTKSNAD